MEITGVRSWRGRFSRYAPLILWTGVVLFLSSSQASMSQTSVLIRPLLKFFFPDASEETLIAYHAFLRKCAHFTEYALLAFWAARAFSGSSHGRLRKYRHPFSLLLVLLLALVDETNQSFIASRTGSPWDVLLDFSGGLAMVSAILLYEFFRPETPPETGREGL